MLENRRYERYDISREKIAVQMYDVTGFSFLGYVKDISKGGFQFKTKSAIHWKENQKVTVYLKFPNEDRVTAIDIRPIRSNRKFFHSYHAAEFVGNGVDLDSLLPLLGSDAYALVTN